MEFSDGAILPAWPTTHISELFKKKQKMCKRKKILQCKESAFGCCWDNIHAAQGPFDKGCPTPKTCKEATHGCCPDGVSAALGKSKSGGELLGNWEQNRCFRGQESGVSSKSLQRNVVWVLLGQEDAS